MKRTLCFLLIPLLLSLAQVQPSNTLAQDKRSFSQYMDSSMQPKPLIERLQDGGKIYAFTALRLAFTPHLIRSDRSESVTFEVTLSGSPTAVTLEIDSLDHPMYDDGTHGDVVAGDFIYTIILSAEQITSRLTESDVFRPFVGFVNLYEGDAIARRFNAFAEIWTPSISPVPIQQLASDVQVSPYLFNIKGSFAATGDDFDTGPLAQKFYQWFGDDYDFLHFLLIPGFSGNRYHLSVQNSTKGLGIDIFDNSAAFGSFGRLQGINVYPVSTFFTMDNGYNHEIGHQWMNFLTDTPLASSIPHWPYSSVGSGVMGISIGQTGVGGFFTKLITPEGDGYRVSGFSHLFFPEFKDLELYLMGLLPKEAVSPILIFKDQSQRPENGFYPDSAFTKVSIDEIVNVMGERVPSVDNAQRDFGIATIVVSDELLSPEEMAFYDYFARLAEGKTPVPVSIGFLKGMGKPFYVATGGRATVALGLETQTENVPPVIVNAIEDTELLLGGESLVRNLTTVFSDGNGDVLSYSESSSNENVASATILDNTLNVTAVGVGTTTITVAADDARGGAMRNIFVVSVDINSAPVVTNTIEDVEIMVGGGDFTRDLNAVFSDPDGDALNFSASSSDEAVATATVSDSLLTVTAIAGGTATITIAADDGRGGSASTAFTVNVPTVVTVERLDDELPKNFALHQNYPNPFNPETIINYELTEATKVNLVIFNLLGQKVLSLVNTLKQAGYHSVVWNGQDLNGKDVPSGVYVYRIKARNFVDSKKLALIR